MAGYGKPTRTYQGDFSMRTSVRQTITVVPGLKRSTAVCINAACAALMLLYVARSEAQDAAAPAKDAVSYASIIRLCGKGFPQVFAQLGIPANIRADRKDSPENDEVFCDYGAKGYGFEVRDKIVYTVYFFSEWTAPILGIKMGNSREEVERTLGKPNMVVRDEKDFITAYGYDLPQHNARLFANLDENGKLWRVEYGLKQTKD